MEKRTIKNLGKIIYKNILKIFAGSGLRRILLIEKTNLLVRSILKPEFVITKKYGHKMFLDKIDSLYLSVYEDWEDFETSIMEKKLKRGHVVLDIGANIGFYTLIMAKLVGERGKVYSFEADPTNFNILKKNVEVNGYKNVVLINKVVLDKNGKIRFYIDEGNTAGNSLFRGNKREYREIDCIKLDNYFNKNDKINFIKMDIEGSEGRAIKGMSNLLKENKEIKIITEFYPKLLDGVGEEVNLGARDYLKFLKREKFKLYEIDEKGNSLILSQPNEILKKSKNKWVNLFCER